MDFDIPREVSFDVELVDKADDFEGLEKLLEEKQQIEYELSELFAEELKNEASKTLYDTKDAYLDAISVEGGVVTLDTSNFVVGMVEEGVDKFDMKPGFLRSGKVRTNAQGKKYLVVPVSKFKRGRYNWRDRQTGRFSKGTNIGGDVEFRIVSENSDPDSWIHPGYIGNFFIDKVLDNFDNVIDEMMDKKIDEII